MSEDRDARRDPAEAFALLRHLLPDDLERSPDHYVVDGVRPGIAFEPTDEEEVATLLRTATEHGLAVVPFGSRTATATGRPLARYDIALDCSAMERVVEYVPDDLTITVEAGMHLSMLQDELREHGQYLPVDPPPSDRVTVGGLLATARPGAWRGHLPGARDLVLGITVALADGTIAKSGGRVVKNVSGYDLHRMHTGAHGTLGVILEASFKLSPLPAATRSLAAPTDSIDAAHRLAMQLWDANLAMRAISVLAPPTASTAGLPEAPHVLVEAAGVAAAVDRTASEVSKAARNTGDAPEDAWKRLRRLAGDAPTAATPAVVLRIGAPASEVGTMVAAATDAGCTAWGHVAAGSVVAHAETLEAASVAALRERAERAGGFLQIDAAPADLRRAVDPFGPGEWDLVRSLKQQFDPTGTLNPGLWMEGV